MSNCGGSTKDQICHPHSVAARTLCLPSCACFSARIWLWALNNLQGSYPASVHFRALGNLLAEWKEKLRSADLVLAYISYSIVGHSRNKKLPSYGKSAYVLRLRRWTRRQSSLSLPASFHVCFFRLYIPKSSGSFSLSNFLQTWFRFFSPSKSTALWNNDPAEHGDFKSKIRYQFSRYPALVFVPQGVTAMMRHRMWFCMYRKNNNKCSRRCRAAARVACRFVHVHMQQLSK